VKEMFIEYYTIYISKWWPFWWEFIVQLMKHYSDYQPLLSNSLMSSNI